jgi:bla regulator protein BlaR1
MAIVASFVSTQQLFGVDRRVFDKTGLTGKFDFFVDFTPQLSRPLPPGSGIELDPTGPTLMEGLKDQLGLKLVPQTGPVDVLVIDHVEEPSPN